MLCLGAISLLITLAAGSTLCSLIGIDSIWYGKIFNNDIAQTEKINIDDYLTIRLDKTKNVRCNCNYAVSDNFKYCPECGAEQIF